ncbi:hypothetical protein F4604DRAFT_1739210 [Suillus subluteus]|nr:hypothetical protein F4604DRAFT_1739210 [Suillus subluteus]
MSPSLLVPTVVLSLTPSINLTLRLLLTPLNIHVCSDSVQYPRSTKTYLPSCSPNSNLSKRPLFTNHKHVIAITLWPLRVYPFDINMNAWIPPPMYMMDHRHLQLY